MMSATELAWRARDQVVRLAFLMRQVRPDELATMGSSLAGQRQFAVALPSGTAARVPHAARTAVLESANRVMLGEWDVLGVTKNDLVLPDRFRDLPTECHSATSRNPRRIEHGCYDHPGDVDHVCQKSRLQHLTLLATAWFLTHEDSYAQLVADRLRSWWSENPFLSGGNWTSGIDVGIRLISLAWIRRLLADWPGVTELFENNGLAVRQVWRHQQYLARFRRRGLSDGSHVIAEAAGQLVASCAFPWFEESDRWRRKSARLLEREILRNTFSSGVGRELASDCQCFIAELGFLAAVEAGASGYPLGAALWERLCAAADSAAALLDARLRPPRQGDCDHDRALLLDAPSANRWPSLLALSDGLVGGLDWWPRPQVDAGSVIVGAMTSTRRLIADRPADRPSRFADAGITLLRTSGHHRLPEIWCRCDGRPLGSPGTAALTHADALSVEIRYGGVDILADPGTCWCCGNPHWRSYFRSTIAHNTVELAGRNQSNEDVPFPLARRTRASEIEVIDDGDVASWTAEHDGYRTLEPPARHRRSVMLDRASRMVDIVDQIEGGPHDVRLAFHFGPDVEVEFSQSCAFLSWPGAITPGAARLELPADLSWSLHCGETDPILGWYAPGLAGCVPAFMLLGRGRGGAGTPLATRLEFVDSETLPKCSIPVRAVSWSASGVRRSNGREIRAEAR
jgi:hypothetical protein